MLPECSAGRGVCSPLPEAGAAGAASVCGDDGAWARTGAGSRDPGTPSLGGAAFAAAGSGAGLGGAAAGAGFATSALGAAAIGNSLWGDSALAATVLLTRVLRTRFSAMSPESGVFSDKRVFLAKRRAPAEGGRSVRDVGFDNRVRRGAGFRVPSSTARGAHSGPGSCETITADGRAASVKAIRLVACGSAAGRQGTAEPRPDA